MDAMSLTVALFGSAFMLLIIGLATDAKKP